MKTKVIGGLVLGLFVGGVVFMIFFLPAAWHVALQWHPASWSRRAVVPGDGVVFVAEHMQTVSNGGRRVLRQSVVHRGDGRLMARRTVYGDLEALGIARDGLLWVDRMSSGGLQALRLPGLEVVEGAAEELIFADERLRRPRRVFVDQAGGLVVAARDGLVHGLDPSTGVVSSLEAGPAPQLPETNGTWLEVRTGAGRLSLPDGHGRRQLRLDGRVVPPDEGYLEGRFLGDRLVPGALRLSGDGAVVLHRSELGPQGKFRLTAVEADGTPRWTVEAAAAVGDVPFELYSHELQWAAGLDGGLLLYALARDRVEERATWTHLALVDGASGRPRWARCLAD